MVKKPKKAKRFRYNLAAVLTYRIIKETKEKERFFELEKRFKKEREKEQAFIQQEINERLGLSNEIREGTIDFVQVTMRKAHLEQLKVELLNQINRRKEAEEKKETQRQVFIQASKEKKILEEDKQKKYEAWKVLMLKEEMKFLDEISTIGFVRKTMLEKEEMGLKQRKEKPL